MQARGRAAQTLWQAYVQQRGSSLGLSLPSSKSLWDVVNRSRLEPHNADAIRDIWMEVGAAWWRQLLAAAAAAAAWGAAQAAGGLARAMCPPPPSLRVVHLARLLWCILPGCCDVSDPAALVHPTRLL